MDATGVPQQGREGAQAEGRLASVAVIYPPVPDDPARWANSAAEREPPWQARYGASWEPLAELGALVRQQGAAAVGMERAERCSALADGGSGLAGFLRVHFARVDAGSLDFYHAALQEGTQGFNVPGNAPSPQGSR